MLTATLAALLVSPGAAAHPTSTSVTVRSADGKAACRVTATEVTCANRAVQSGHKPVALVLSHSGRARVAGRTLSWSSSTPVLRKGASRRLGAFTCKGVGAGLLCGVANGGAIGASSSGISVLAPPATH